MTNKLQQYFPMIRTREEVLNEIESKSRLKNLFYEWTEENQNEFLDFCTGVKGIKQFIVNWLARNKTRLTEDYIGELQKFGKWFGNQTSGIIEIKLWNLYHKKEREFLEHYKSIPEINQKLEMCDGVENLLGTATGVLIEILIYLLCGYLVCKGEMSIGNLLAFISYSMYVASPLEIHL